MPIAISSSSYTAKEMEKSGLQPRNVGGGHWSVRVNRQSDTEIPQKEALRQLRHICTVLDQANIPKYEKCVSGEVFDSVLTKVSGELGFCVEKKPSGLVNGGTGVFVTRGKVAKHSLTAIYPGTIYRPGEPIFIQSIANAFLFRCADGILIDGNDGGLSRIIFTSCTFRDRIGPHLASDMTWLTSCPVIPLAIGQYVNNFTPENPANVIYQELDLPLSDFPPQLRRFVPTATYSSLNGTSFLRLVVLISLREIECGEELLSSYFTVIT